MTYHSYHNSTYVPISNKRHFRDNNIVEVLTENLSYSDINDVIISTDVKQSICDISDNMFKFQPTISSLKDIITMNGIDINRPTFYICRNVNIITLSWEPFFGTIITSNLTSFNVIHSLNWLPLYTVELPIIIYLKNNRYNGSVIISPNDRHIISFHFQSGLCGRINDILKMPGGCVQWLSLD